MGVPQNQGSPRADIIYISVSIYITEDRSLTPGDDGRLAADRAKCAHWRIHSAGDKLLRALV
jgi:hypothetical protein